MTTQYSFFKRNRLAVAMAAVMCLPAVAHAGEGKPVEINIDAAPASVVLLKLAEASGAQIVFSQDIGNLTLPAIRGEHTLESALELVLKESGLEYEMLSEDSVVIKAGSGSDSSGDGQTREVDEEVVITGSRISRDVASGRTVSPVTVITGDDMAKQGFGTVADALSSVSAVTGQTEFNDFLSSQAPTARPVNLRGFGPGRTLILINGQRIASYPIPAGGGNFANTAQIPAAAVERVEILSGGASAIYGSDAVAGVINIITKEELDQTSISVRASGTQDGGASDRRVQFTSGVNADNWNLTYGLEYSERNPLRLSNRAWSDSYADAPNIALTANERERLSVDGEIQTFFPGAVAVPTQASCAALGLQFVPSSFNEVDNSGRGAACVVGTDAAPPGVLLPETDSYSAFAGWRYDINDDLQLKLRASYWSSETAHDPGFMEASARADLGFGVFPVGVRRFFSAEAGNINTLFDEETMDFSAQLSGRWDKFFYEINMVHSAADFESRRRVFLRSFETALGSNFLAAHTPQTLAQSVGVTQRNGESESSSVNMIVSGELFDLPAGPAKFASIAEYTRETIRDGLDARSVAGDFAGVGATSGQSGRRGHIALGAELILPVSDTLTVPLAARYDKYNDITQVDDAITYSLGLEYRPVDRLLVRALMSTSFRAPDMEAVYRATTVDRFRFRNYADCHNAGVASYNECVSRGLVFPNLAVDVQSGGNASLQEEEGKSYNIGAVYDISDSLTLSLDLYRLSLEGILASASSDSAYRLATSCQFGQDPGGNPVDPNSALCRAVSRSFNFNNATNSLVPSGTGVAITNSSFNSSLREQDGMDVKLDGHFNFGDASLSAGLTYTHIFKIRFQELPGGPIDNRFRDNETNGELRSRATLTTTWSQGPWSVTLYGQHLGSAPRQNPSFGSANRGRLAPWTSWTLSGDFELTGSLGLSLIVNNLFDKEPSFDESAIGSPFRNVSLYSTLGRQYVIDLSYRF